MDINAADNGLYRHCIEFNAQCELIRGGPLRGGPWRPENSRSFTADSATVRLFDEAGIKWGGNILGKQKDFMHFSPTGY